MRSERGGKPFGERIFEAYELSDAQREACDAVHQELIESWRRGMGERFDECQALRAQMMQHDRKRMDIARAAADGDKEAKAWIRNNHEDSTMVDLHRRVNQLTQENPFDWSELADRIEDILPPEQAKRGRTRLAWKYPLTVSPVYGQSLLSEAPANAGTDDKLNSRANGPVDAWDAYILAFKKRYQPSQAQQSAIESILKELRGRRTELARAAEIDIKSYKDGEFSETAKRRRELLQLDVEELFQALRTRLDGLLTTAQREYPLAPRKGAAD